jgi:hypothetical protein
MTIEESKDIRSWIERWAETGPMLDKLRLKEYRCSNLSDTLLSLADINDAALLAHPPKPESGLIEMQRLFAQLRTNEASS